MSDSITVLRTYQYRLYSCDAKDRKLRHKLWVASTVWNHFIALQRRYYRLTGQYLPLNRMNAHVLKLRRTQRFAVWRDLHSQVCQNVCRRVDDGYQRFFAGLNKRPPKFRKARKYKSFTFPQTGYKLLEFNQNVQQSNGKYRRARATIQIGGTTYKFVQHRPLNGQIKTLTVKRDAAGGWWLSFSVFETLQIDQTDEASTGKSGGFDFGLKTFLTDDEGRGYPSPQYFAQGLHKIRHLHRQLSRKVPGSKRRHRTQVALAKHSAKVANRRRSHHFLLAHRLSDEYDVLYFEDLNLQGMKALWGRKVSDLGFAEFLNILEWVALKRGKQVMTIGRFERTTGKCSGCGYEQALELHERTFHCARCGLVIDRDHNSAITIKRVGASTPYRSGSQTQVRLRNRVEGKSPRP